MRGLTIVVSAMVFCAATSFFGDTSLLTGAVAQSWVPYVAVPFAVRFAAHQATVVRAGVLGALSSVLIIVAFCGVRLSTPAVNRWRPTASSSSTAHSAS